uniref:Diacylglycerol O-acyltransferase n=1 Tax=Kalanchoe fedtschenkoi TaxID=63787 RepID=A0A7N0ZQN4_KALFE
METWKADDGHAPTKFKIPKPIDTEPSAAVTEAISAARIEIAKMGSPPEDGQPLSPMGRLFHKPESNMYIVSIVGTKSWIDPDHFKLNIIPFYIYPRFNCLQVPDESSEDAASSANLRWAKAEVDLEQHIFTRYIESKYMADGGADKYIEDFLYELTKTSIDMSKPLWDVHILNLSEPTSQGAMAVTIVRFHHSIGDGMSLMSFFLSLTRKASDPNTPPSLPVLFRKPAKRQSKMRLAWWFMSFIWNTLVDVLTILATAFFLVDTPNPLKGPEDAGKNPRRIMMRCLSMDDVKLVKDVTKTTINDVVMGATEAALTRYLNRRYGEENKIRKNGNDDNLPKTLRVRGAILFNVRVLPGFQPMDTIMEKRSGAKWGNRVGHVLYPLKLKLHDDNPLEYVYKANAVMNRKKASLGSYFSYYFGNFIINTFGIKLASLPTNTSFWFSNMPGPQEEITMFGYPVAYVGCSCYGQPMALFIHAITYADKLNFVISVDEHTICDPQQLCDDLEQSFELIKTAAMAKRCRAKQQ